MTGPYKLTLELPGLPTINLNGAQGSWKSKWQRSNNWKQAVMLVVGHRKPEAPLKQAKIKFTRHSSVRPDFDNLAGSFKPLMDGLKLAGVIVDDKHANVGKPEYDWILAPRGAGYVTIEVVESGDAGTQEMATKGLIKTGL